ncbi:MAG: LutC/YkgG family protein [Cellvibrionaceae bacterium]
MNQEETLNKKIIFDAIQKASPSVVADINAIQQDALDILNESSSARPSLLSDIPCEAFIKRIENELVIGTTCETVTTLAKLPEAVYRFLKNHSLDKTIKLQNKESFLSLDWSEINIDADIEEDNSVGICWAEYGVAETGSFVIHSSPDMPILLNFLPLYLLPVIPKSKILPFMDDYALIANEIAKNGETPRNMCMISGASGTTDIEGVLVQGAHGPEFVHIIIIDDM